MIAATQTQTVFDQTHYLSLIKARAKTIRDLITQIKPALELKTALDAGCGVGFFAGILAEYGLTVRAFDGRLENIEEGGRRFPQIHFDQGDIQSERILGLGQFDLVLCFGLLYHLENPLLAIRHLRALTSKVLLLETMCLPTNELKAVLREEPNLQDQSLTDLALYLSEGCISKMLFRAGFGHVYRVGMLPDHDEFRRTRMFSQRRTVLVATSQALPLPSLVPLSEPKETAYPWEICEAPSLRWRIKRFWNLSAGDKCLAISRRLLSKTGLGALPLHLPFGAWWIARRDNISEAILSGSFETSEYHFARRFLRAGMTVLDVGAHHGFYSLLASSLVGRSGKVFSFEPSPRERKALTRHLRINMRSNVFVQAFAVGSANERANLYQVNQSFSGCNSLRAPAVEASSTAIPVQVRRLDDWILENAVDRVDFMKIDVEGGELLALQGAVRLLERKPRPVILAEIEDKRTQPWGYSAGEIVAFLEGRGYCWYSLGPQGDLIRLPKEVARFDANLVAIPQEVEEATLAAIAAA